MRTAEEWIFKINEEKLEFAPFLTLFQGECLDELQDAVRKLPDESVVGNVTVAIFRKYGRVWDAISASGIEIRMSEEFTGVPAPGAFVKKMKMDFGKMDFDHSRLNDLMRSAIKYL